MKWKPIVCCLIIGFVLAVVTAVPRLNSIADLRNSHYASEFPRHGLILLFWFAKNVHVDNDGDMNMNLYNNLFEQFHNNENILPPGGDYRYVGNLKRHGLPRYVKYCYRNSRSRQRNRDRLIFSVDVDLQIEQIFVTSHRENLNTFDPHETYEITFPLLREIRNYHRLSLYLHDVQYYFDFRIYRRCEARRHKRMSAPECEVHPEVSLQIKSSEKGHAKITWKEIPGDLLSMINYIGLFKDADSDNALVKVNPPISKSGELATTIPLNPGLQIRLIHYNTSSGLTQHAAILNGSDFDEANGAMPTKLTNYKASLLLYVKDGQACARLYIDKSFKGWKTEFQNAWVGFYTTDKDDSSKPKNKELVTKFTQTFIKEEEQGMDLDLFEYKSNLPISPGMQARFMLNNDKGGEKARTVPWDAAESEYF